MKNSNRVFDVLLIMLIDVCCIIASYLFAFELRFMGSVPEYNFDSFLLIVPWMLISTVFVMHFFDLYKVPKRIKLSRYLYGVIISNLLLVLLFIAISFWFRGFSFPRSVFVIATLIQLSLMIIFRTLVFKVQLIKYGRKKIKLIVNNRGKDISFLQNNYWYINDGYIEVNNYKKEDLNNIDVVLIASDISYKHKQQIINDAREINIEIMMIPNNYDLSLMDSEVHQLSDKIVLSFTPPKRSWMSNFSKRSFDVICALLLLMLTSPIILFVLAVIPMTSKGSIFYVQDRVGQEGKIFKIYKFRSMVQNAEENTGPVFSSKNDSRVTSFGRFLRSSRIDELPQLFNVLKGDMSIVGPRPEREVFVNQFLREIPEYKERMRVKPGITGLAQIYSYYDTKVIDKLKYDLIYVRNFNLFFDLKILFLTIIIVLAPEIFRKSELKKV